LFTHKICFYFVLSAAILPLPWRKPDTYVKTLRRIFAMILGYDFRPWLYALALGLACGGWLVEL
jgi:hypothetical protein